MHALESLPLLCYAIFVGPFFLSKAEWPQGGYFMNEIAKKVMGAMLAIQRYPWEQGVCAQALYEAGETQLYVAMAHDAVLRQTPDGRLAVTGRNIACTDPAANGEAVLRAYELTGREAYLAKAREALGFTLSGEDDVLGGGIYFQETFTQYEPQKNTICSAVAILASMQLYELTGEESWLEHARRIEKWTSENLLDAADNLLWDAKMVDDGEVNTRKWSYNAGFMVRGWLRLYKATGEERYLTQARNTLAAAEKQWYNSLNGALNDPGYFAFALVDAWFDLYDMNKDKATLMKALRAIEFIHESLKDANGRYPEYWSEPLSEPVAEYDLRMESCVAYLYMRAAGYFEQQ